MPAFSPATSYVVWHTQRTGSTLLCTTLDATNVAGRPDEWPEDRLTHTTDNASKIRDDLWSRQTTSNGVLGVKFGYYEPTIESFFRLFGQAGRAQRAEWREAWESVFPNCRHVVMTRRDKNRLAVSWWKSINGGPGHVSQDGTPLPWQDDVPSTPAGLAECYDFEAIRALITEVGQREAGIQDLLSELQVPPLTITYEDFVADYDETVRDVLEFLDLNNSVSEIPPPLLATTSDDVNEQWLQRFVSDLDERS
jgi:LPS sulfotransferase NodH